MKRQDSNPSLDSDPPEDIEFDIRRDVTGILTEEQWSCIALDVGDRIAPALGKTGIEAQYWLAQRDEALSVFLSSDLKPLTAKMFREAIEIPFSLANAQLNQDSQRLIAKIKSTRYR